MSEYPKEFLKQVQKTIENQRELGVEYTEIKDPDFYFYKRFWVPTGCDRIRHPKIACRLLDLAVHIGNLNAIRVLQKSVNLCKGTKVQIDGNINEGHSPTIDAINERNALILMSHFKTAQWRFYLNLIGKKPELEIYRNKWYNRAFI